MATTEVRTPTARRTTEELSARFARLFEDFEPGDLFADDAFFDLNMPVWRFQLEGGRAFAEQLRSIAQGPSRLHVLRTVQTASGFVTEHEEHQDVDGHDHTARRMWLCEVRDGRIADVVGYCSGEWDEALRARHAVEAPMLRGPRWVTG